MQALRITKDPLGSTAAAHKFKLQIVLGEVSASGLATEGGSGRVDQPSLPEECT